MKLSTYLKNRKEAGFSLLELLLVVGVGAILLLAGIATYRLVTEGSNANEATRLLTTLKQQTQRAFQGQASYGNVNDDLVPVLTELRAFPTGTLNASGVPQHPWGGDIRMEAGNNGQSFLITFEGITNSTCLKLGQAFNAADDSDFVAFSVDNNVLDAGNDGVIELADLQNACDDGVDISWEFF